MESEIVDTPAELDKLAAPNPYRRPTFHPKHSPAAVLYHMTPTAARRPSTAQLKALEVAAAGRAEFGSEFPNRDRRAAARGRHIAMSTFLIDGHGIYGAGQHLTWQTLEDRGWITVRHDLIPTTPVPARTVDYTSMAGKKTITTLPAHDAPADPGWRAKVEITESGAAVLARYQSLPPQ